VGGRVLGGPDVVEGRERVERERNRKARRREGGREFLDWLARRFRATGESVDRWVGDGSRRSPRAALVVEEAPVVEIKCVDRLLPIHAAQLLTYMRLTALGVGLLVNFRETVLRHGLRRVVLSPAFASSCEPLRAA